LPFSSTWRFLRVVSPWLVLEVAYSPPPTRMSVVFRNVHRGVRARWNGGGVLIVQKRHAPLDLARGASGATRVIGAEPRARKSTICAPGRRCGSGIRARP